MDYVMGDGSGNIFISSNNLVAAPKTTLNFDGSLLSVVGEEQNYTGDITSDSWIETTPAGAPTSSVYADSSAYLGNDVIIVGLRLISGSTAAVMPYITRDGGVSWETLPAGLGYVGSYTTAMGPGKAVSTSHGLGQIGYTEDYGETWITKAVDKPGEQVGFYICYAGINNSGEDVLVAGTYPNGQIWYSTDNAATWTQSSYVSGVTSISLLVGVGNGVVCAIQNDSKIIRSTDFGQTWTVVYTIGGNYFSHLHVINNNRLIMSSCTYSASMYGARVYSDDKGLTWTSISDTHTNDYIALGNNQVLALRHIWENATNNNPILAYAYSSDNGLTFGAYTSTGYRSSGKAMPAHYIGNGRTVISTTMSTSSNYGWQYEGLHTLTLGLF